MNRLLSVSVTLTLIVGGTPAFAQEPDENRLQARTDQQATRQGSGNWARRHPVLLSSMIGAAAGGAAGCAIGSDAPNPDVSCGFYVAPFAALGAGLGLSVGLLIDALSQEDPTSQHLVYTKIKSGQRVVAFQSGQRSTIGRVIDVSGESFVVADSNGRRTTFANADVKARVTPDSLKNGFLIGSGIGALFAAVAYRDSGAMALVAIPAWALIGAGVDKAIKHDELLLDEHTASSTHTLQVFPWFRPGAGGVALALGF